ncbi:hypothetical protein J3459_015890 [Metarhizium acridum]|uniref:2EXR domain-containing protein n=1 Tax=Metarhizium acridum (strain CQMa 102) TaxID=655827 RepID=E9EG44_METAQ|nr:uncharacterized protein MAC_08842 [Metarhizium acridum CQMa 102]EFY85127.1 hypothetical protein MAC_08842 [Metarhizium acridum CQMa 102]KAG8411222.1 hypothetical protein J3459_016509 [Metarhizium acridum]KAG8412515.1 hypothetical protein J3459_015890 [Metarhizium acridum]
MSAAVSHHTRPQPDEARFPAFSQLPAEIRHEIWHLALSASWSWSGNVYDGRRERRALTGVFRRQVSLSCREAQHIFKSRSVFMASFHTWIDVSCHVFYLRAPLYPRELERARHVVLNPVGWQMLLLMVEMVSECCRELSTLVVVAPWADPRDLPADQTPETWAPLEDWRMICAPHTMEEHQDGLVHDIECSGAAEEMRTAEYHARLLEAAGRVPKAMHERDHVFGRLLIVLRKLNKALGEFSGTAPRLYLRTASQLRAW